MREALPHSQPNLLEPDAAAPVSAEAKEAQLIRDWLVVEGIQRLLAGLQPDMLDLFGQALEQVARDLRAHSTGLHMAGPVAVRKPEAATALGRRVLFGALGLAVVVIAVGH